MNKVEAWGEKGENVCSGKMDKTMVSISVKSKQQIPQVLGLTWGHTPHVNLPRVHRMIIT